MTATVQMPTRLAAFLVYSRPLLVFGGMICAMAVMWGRNPVIYTLGVSFLFVSMTFDLVDGWFSTRFRPNAPLAPLADRLMDKLVYSIIFPVISVGMIWRLLIFAPDPTHGQLLHAMFVLLLCVTVLIRDSFATFMRGFAIRQGMEPESSEYNRLRTIAAAPVSALLYAYAFYVPDGPLSPVYVWVSRMGNMPLRDLFFVEILFLIINLGSIAAYCRKYGAACLDELCLGDEVLRRRILAFFPNALTVMNAMIGLIAVFFAYQGRFREAYLMIIGAATFDKLDGAVARRLGLTEPMPDDFSCKKISLGSLLDDFADAVSFCIVPAWIFYIAMAESVGSRFGDFSSGWIALLYVGAGIGRLIYFTLDKSPIPGFFKGLPTPAAALMVLSPLVVLGQALDASQWAVFWCYVAAAGMVLASIIMNVYFIRYIHFGRAVSRHPWFGRLNMLLLLIFVFTPFFGFFCLAYSLVYLFSPLFTWRISPEEAAKECPMGSVEDVR